MKDWLLRPLRQLRSLERPDQPRAPQPQTTPDGRWTAKRLPDPSAPTLWLFAGGCFADELARKIRLAKYAGHWPSVLALRTSLAGATRSGLWRLQPLLIPMPSDPKRLGQRGFHLPVEMARQLRRLTGCPLDRTALIKTQHTPEQASLGRDQRLRNLSHRFKASARLLGQMFVLVDDVLVTGASFVAARQALSQVGAEVIAGVVLADARPASSMMKASGADERPSGHKALQRALKPRPKTFHPPDQTARHAPALPHA